MRVIVTGAANGIGRATALRLAELYGGPSGELSLCLADLDAGRLGDLADELKAKGNNVCTVEGDLQDAKLPGEIVRQAVKSFHGLDAVVSNAGITNYGPLKDLGADSFDKIFAINVRAGLLLAGAAHQALSESKGALVFTSSISASQPTVGYGAYSASKAALSIAMKQMAAEWGKDGIRCNAVAPGYTVTEATEFRYSDPVVRGARETVTPIGAICTPDKVADAICFLLSPQSEFITGVDLLIDGGLSTGVMQAWNLVKG